MESDSSDKKTPTKKDEKTDRLKRHRTSFTKEQTRILEAAFQESRKLNKGRCEELVKQTAVERRSSICIWFNNRRVKERKLMGRKKEKEKRKESPENGMDSSNTDESTTLTPPATSPTAAKPTKSSPGRKPKLLKYRYPRGPRRKNRTPPRMIPLPKIDSPHRGPPDVTLPFSELKFMLTCMLCKDFLYNATTLTECLHSFCKACLLNYVARNLHCPTCKLLIHPSNPYLNIRIDHTVQDIVYKILPQVEKDQKQKEKEFYVSRGLPYPPKPIDAPTPPPVDCMESDEESDTSESSDESEAEEIVPPKWISILLQYAGATEGLGAFQPLEKNFLRVPSAVTAGQIRRLVKMKLQLTYRTDVELYIFADTTLVHDSLSIDEIKELFFTDEEDELLIMQYGISSSKRNLFAELSNSNPDDFADDYCDEASGKRYISGDDVNNCGYEFLTKSVEPDVDFPIVKSEEIKIKEEVQDLDTYTMADV